MRIPRRDFLAAIAGTAATLLTSFRADAQQPMPIVGMLEGAAYLGYGPTFRQGLAEAGFVEGRNVVIEERSAEGQYERLPALAAEFVHRPVAVIAAITPVAALAAKAATSTIPIVFELGSDPVKDKLVASMARPGGNVTGVTFFANLLTAKRLELLHDMLPQVSVVGFLVNPNNANAALELDQAESAARALNFHLVIGNATTAAEIDEAFAEFARQKAAAVLMAGDAFLNNSRSHQIAALALRLGMATCFTGRFPVTAGGLVNYGASRQESSRQLGLYVGRVLKGEKPADLPVVQPTKFELVINLVTAKALGLTIDRELLLRADEVIE